jgi:hypothetical protein
MREDIVRAVDKGLEAIQTRVAIRQSLARDENEAHTAPVKGRDFAEYSCECASRLCDQLLSLTVTEYDEVRSVATHFVVARGHVDPRAEFVVRETARYQVVQKFGVAGEVATRLDQHLLSEALERLGS